MQPWRLEHVQINSIKQPDATTLDASTLDYTYPKSEIFGGLDRLTEELNKKMIGIDAIKRNAFLAIFTI